MGCYPGSGESTALDFEAFLSSAAQHRGVTPSRVRAILSAREICCVTGYSADEIRAATRRQGGRTDRVQVEVPGCRVVAGPNRPGDDYRPPDEQKCLRYFFEFIRGADAAVAAALT